MRRQVPVSISNPKATVLETVVDFAFRIGEKRVERFYAVTSMEESEPPLFFSVEGRFVRRFAPLISDRYVKNDTGVDEPRVVCRRRSTEGLR